MSEKTQIKEEEVLITGGQASEIFNLPKGLRFAVRKGNLHTTKKTEKEWKKFFIENRFI